MTTVLWEQAPNSPVLGFVVSSDKKEKNNNTSGQGGGASTEIQPDSRRRANTLPGRVKWCCDVDRTVLRPAIGTDSFMRFSGIAVEHCSKALSVGFDSISQTCQISKTVKQYHTVSQTLSA